MSGHKIQHYITMKKIITLAALSAAISVSAQDTYVNNQITNQADIIGTSRYVSMGGAMGALGADISTISSNPAGIAMMKKNDISLTVGGNWGADRSASGMAPNNGGVTLDQAGIVASFPMDGKVKNFKISFNYQRKINYKQAFYGEVATGASFADQLYDMASVVEQRGTFNPWDQHHKSIYGAASAAKLWTGANALGNSNLSYASGSLNSFDFNLSANIQDQFFLGLTFGMDRVDWRQSTEMWEQRNGDIAGQEIQDFAYMNDQHITGHGFNFKLGTIIRPVKDNPFRIGLTIESPTWYRLEYIDDQSISSKYYYKTPEDFDAGVATYDPTPRKYYDYYAETDNYLKYRLTTPWKFRTQLGTTFGKSVALGAEYEYAMYQNTSMSYPDYNGRWIRDQYIDAWTEGIIRGQHTLRLGIEVKPIESLSLRAGYNYITSIYKPGAFWDAAVSPQSYVPQAVDYPTSLQYLNLTDTHIATAGLGYRAKKFYVDLAYKYRIQNGDYYAFSSAHTGSEMNAIPVNLSRHSISATIGFKF